MIPSARRQSWHRPRSDRPRPCGSPGTGPATTRCSPNTSRNGTWSTIAAIGSDDEKTAAFVITAVFIRQDMSDYSENATDYQHHYLVPSAKAFQLPKDQIHITGLVNSEFPPGTDVKNGDAINVQRNGKASNC
ncbi:hypothetical protein [Streptomyces sp. NPDC005209]|uniref:hypothetical protein n=1 Tax=Streptomyces sp. NPDC005209 TaxID=3156715 RepID=UPI0033A62D07